MNRPLGRFLFTLLAVWLLLGGVAIYFSRLQDISPALMGRLLPAFLWEAACYLLIGAEPLRDALICRVSPKLLALALWVSALLPYLLYTSLTGTGSLATFAWLCMLSAILSGWFVFLPRHIATDLGFLLVMTGLLIYRPSSHFYIRVAPRLDVNILGRITFIRTGILAVLLLRRLGGVRAGFVPSGREWRVGIVHYLLFLPVGFLLFQLLPLGQFRLASSDWTRIALLAIVYFLGFLWVLALSEEFFCRGYLQQVLGRGLKSETAGWVLASLLFGLAHLWFRGFPNWRWVILATILGLFCGHAYRKTRSIGSAMVTHALVVTTWRLLFA